jgi:hypothetical protein
VRVISHSSEHDETREYSLNNVSSISSAADIVLSYVRETLRSDDPDTEAAQVDDVLKSLVASLCVTTLVHLKEFLVIEVTDDTGYTTTLVCERS